MNLSQKLISITAAFAALLFIGCKSTNSNSTFNGESEINAPAERPQFPSGTPLIVHVDSRERIATVRNISNFGGEYVVTRNRQGTETSILKLHTSDPQKVLKKADILEGSPSIGNGIFKVEKSRATDLAKIYSDPEPEIE